MGAVSHSTFGAFVLLGFGTGWSLADALFGNMATFMARLPEGLLLPTHAELIGKGTIAVVLLVCWAGTTLRGASLTLGQFQRLLWVLYALVLGGTIVGGLAWQVTLGPGGVAVVLLVLFAVAYAVGTVTVTLVLPLLPLFYEEALLSAIITGNGLGCLFSGGLGLLQARGVQPHSARVFGLGGPGRLGHWAIGRVGQLVIGVGVGWGYPHTNPKPPPPPTSNPEPPHASTLRRTRCPPSPPPRTCSASGA
jgi:hypothetical protein